MSDIRIKRVHDEPATADGARILVDRLWPRGLTKERVHATAWLKEIGPSHELRKWFGHDPARWKEFRTRYFAELDENRELVSQLLAYAKEGPVTLVYSARDTAHNQAVALREYLSAGPRGS